MTNVNLFMALCGVMLAVAVAWVLWPLLKAAPSEGTTKAASYSQMAFVAACVVMLSIGLYVHVSTWPWGHAVDPSINAEQAAVADAQAEAAAYQARVTANPDDIEGWLLLGDAWVKAENFPQSQVAFQHAYDLSKGQNVEAVTGLAEALILSDPTSANGRAAVLVDEALKLSPNHPKALWYGGLVALQENNLAVARDRFRSLLALNPPDNIRGMLTAQIDRLSQQLGEATPASSGPSRKVVVHVTLAEKLKTQIKQPMSLFVLARNPKQAGPPLAVERHQSTELPLQVELTRDDAMLPSMSLMSADEVDIVARLSTSGMPTEQPGDYYGLVHYSFAKQGDEGNVSIEINQRVP